MKINIPRRVAPIVPDLPLNGYLTYPTTMQISLEKKGKPITTSRIHVGCIHVGCVHSQIAVTAVQTTLGTVYLGGSSLTPRDVAY